MAQIGSYTPDNLIAGIMHEVTSTSQVLTLGSGDLLRGTAIALNTVTNKLVPYVDGGADGAGDFYAILASNTADLAADASVVVYKSGQFNENAIIFTGAGDADGIREVARGLGIYLESAIYNNSAV